MEELIPVRFQEDTLFLISFGNEPYVPIRPVVEAMGLDWEGQRQRINRNRERWRAVIVTTPSKGQLQRHLCLPLRKLNGFLATIDASRIRKKLRKKVLAYQDGCDDALWKHWTDLVAGCPSWTPEKVKVDIFAEIDCRARELADEYCEAMRERMLKDAFVMTGTVPPEQWEPLTDWRRSLELHEIAWRSCHSRLSSLDDKISLDGTTPRAIAVAQALIEAWYDGKRCGANPEGYGNYTSQEIEAIKHDYHEYLPVAIRLLKGVRENEDPSQPRLEQAEDGKFFWRKARWYVSQSFKTRDQAWRALSRSVVLWAREIQD
ncbi:hypothetical protein GF1_16200 [Desulfolithobacter dissulfuricans]|uniref:Antirepressor protein ant N-terminal domain-containing protein n=1 Tax=Desulfolithobacter dissulfuricans TaxID=2795293 RepID=A0A915XHZ3_9BACT|nr:phage antirepressor N-terminal domain-containing protein [Desulfolithobacter dissulfuricans]BCO09244.1 hypothetical protein GF1_16200 [Desulfolithobacter dissulfuricans]